MADAKTNGFRWLPSYYIAVRDLPDSDRLALYDAIADYGFGNDVNELSPMLKAIFSLIQPTLDKSIKFEDKQKTNGVKGGRPKAKPKETQNGFGFSEGKPKETQTDFGENLDIDVDIDNAIERQTPERVLSRRGSPDEFGPIIHEQDTGTVPAYITGRNLDG